MSKSYDDLELEVLEDDSTLSSNQDGVVGTISTCGYDDSKVSQEPMKKHVGRREAPTTQMFARLHTKNGKPLKKEYQRCQIIRGIKKCARYMITGRKPQKGIHQFDLRDQEKMKIWQAMEQLVSSNPDLFTSLGSTCEGPATDGKVIRKRTRQEAPEFRSFNDDYCRHFYMPEQVREFHYYYLQLVYGIGAVDPKSVSEKLVVFCCNGCHSDLCTAIWERVRNYVMFEMIEQLGLEAYGTRDIFQADMNVMEDDMLDFEFGDPDSYLA